MSHNEVTLDDQVLYQDDNPQRALLSSKSHEARNTDGRNSCGWIPARFVLTIWTFFGLFVVYALRANLSVAIVAMVKNHPKPANETNNSSSCPKLGNHTSPEDEFDPDGEFDWDDETQGVILGAFFYGYIITQLPGGLLAERFGGKWLFGIGTLITALVTILTPLAARCHVSVVIIARFIAGIGEGVTFPAYFTLYSHWIPRQERSVVIAITSSGSHFGIIAAMPATAWLCEYGFSGGWPSVFYVFGTVGCAWFCFWALFISDRPENHPYISPAELKYIVENRGNDKKILHCRCIPWKYILTSLPLWALSLTKLGNSWTYYTMMTELPNFLKKVLNYPIGQNGALNSILYTAIAVSSIIAGATSDIIRAQAWISVTLLRKIFQGTASFLPAIGLSLIPFMGCNSTGIIALLLVSMTFSGFLAGGESPSCLDMSPEYVGVVFGIANCIGNMAGFLAPFATGNIIAGDGGHERWQYVFYLASAVNIVGGTAYLIFGSASPQPWPLPYQEISSSTAEAENNVNCDKISDSKCIQVY